MPSFDPMPVATRTPADRLPAHATHLAHTAHSERRRTARTGPCITRYGVDDIVGTSAAVLAAVDVATAAARTMRPVTIVGESGTGKELFAQAVHDASARRHRPFVVVDGAAVSPEQTIARFRAADGGTLFLDELCALPLAAQASLLRVLQAQAFAAADDTRIDADEARVIDVRVIAATSRSVQAALDSGALRSDLSERLDGPVLALPPLRDRLDDVPALARHFLEQAAVEVGRPGLVFAPAVVAVLSRHAWPGNVRELRSLVRRLASLCIGNVITIGQLPPALLGAMRAP